MLKKGGFLEDRVGRVLGMCCFASIGLNPLSGEYFKTFFRFTKSKRVDGSGVGEGEYEMSPGLRGASFQRPHASKTRCLSRSRIVEAKAEREREISTESL